MAVIRHYRTALLQAATTRFNLPTDRGVILGASAYLFKLDTAGNPTPASISFAATLVGMEGNVTWEASAGLTLTGTTGSAATLTYANMTAASGTVRAKITVDGHEYVSQPVTITKVSDGAAGTDGVDGVFATVYVWDFRNTLDGWTADGASATLTAAADSVTVTPAIADARIASPAISINGAMYDKIRARVRRKGGTGWDGVAFYGTSAHGFSGSYIKYVTPDPTILNEWVIVEWDMAKLSAGGADWTTNTITQLRLDLGTTMADVFDIDWIVVGKYGPVTLGGLGYTGDANASSDITLNGSTSLTVSGNKVTRTTGPAAWDAHCYSKESFTGGAFAYARPGASGCSAMFGLNSDPLADASYSSLDYAIYTQGDGVLSIYESGTFISNHGTWAVGDALTITYDGKFVCYLKNNALLRRVATTPNRPFYFDSSFNTVGSQFTNVRFGPLSSVFTSTARGNAINEDPAIENSAYWLTTANVTRLTGTTGTNAAGTNYFLAPNASTLDGNAEDINAYTVDPNKTYKLTANLMAEPGNNRNMYIYLNFYDASGALLTTAGWGGAKSGYVYGAIPTSDWAWRRYGDLFGAGTSRAIPAAARTMKIGVWFQYSGSGTSSVQQGMQDIRLEFAEAPFTVNAGADVTTSTTNGATRTIVTRTATLSGGKAPIKCNWVDVSGNGGLQLSFDPTTATVTVKAGGYDEVKSGVISLTATDDAGRSATDSFNVSVTFGTPP